MRKLILLAVAVMSLPSCTVSVWEKNVAGVEPRSERGKDGNLVPRVPAIVVQQFGVFPPAPSGTASSSPQQTQSGDTTVAKSGMPVPPVLAPSYPTVYPSKWDDPTLVVIQNQSARFVRVKIDDSKEEIRLSPYQTTADINLDVGEHRLRVTVEKPTAAFGMKTVEHITSFTVRPNGRSQVIQINDY